MSVALPIEEDPRFRQYIASAGQKVFAIPFPFQQDEDIEILIFSNNQASSALPSDYTIIGASAHDGGSVTFKNGRAAGDIITIVGSAVLDRLSSVVRDGRFSSKLIDDEFDRNRIIQQEQKRDISRSLKAPYGSKGVTLLATAPSSLLHLDEQGNIVSSETPIKEKILREEADLALAALIGQSSVISDHFFETQLALSLADVSPTFQGGYSSAGDTPLHMMKRVAIEPPHAGKRRSLDRYMPDGTTNPINGGWWELVTDVANVKLFGAKGDGVNDDSFAIQSAIFYAQTASIGRVFIPNSTSDYLVNATIVNNCTTPLTIEGAGRGLSRLKGGSGVNPVIKIGDLSAYSNKPQRIKDLSFEFPGNGLATHIKAEACILDVFNIST